MKILFKGGISIAYVTYGKYETKTVNHISPFFYGDLIVSSIDKHITDLAECTTLYPNIWKYEAFDVPESNKSKSK